MFFITGMMGPYMSPMALNVPISMLMSKVVDRLVNAQRRRNSPRGRRRINAREPQNMPFHQDVFVADRLEVSVQDLAGDN